MQGDNYFYTGVEAKKKDPKAPFAMVLSAPVLSFAGAMVINKNTEHPYASALFVDWTLSPDSQNLINSILRGPLTIKHPYLPDNVKLVTYNIVERRHHQTAARGLEPIDRPDEITARVI